MRKKVILCKKQCACACDRDFLYSEINKYFENLSVVGWFLSRMGFSTEVNEKITKLHIENFRGKDKVLFVMDSLECEDAFYICEKNRLIRQRGYYIYYVRNEAMQNYIISRKNATTEDKNDETVKKDAELVKNFQNMRNDNVRGKAKNKPYFVYAVASFTLIFAISMGIVVSGSYDKMKDLESAIKKIETGSDETGVQVFSNSNSEETIYTNDIDATEKEVVTNEDTEAESESENEEMTEDTQYAEETISTGSTTYYTIEEGDTLMSISLKMYDSPDYVNEIMNANSIEEGDVIYPGEKIVIPYVK